MNYYFMQRGWCWRAQTDVVRRPCRPKRVVIRTTGAAELRETDWCCRAQRKRCVRIDNIIRIVGTPHLRTVGTKRCATTKQMAVQLLGVFPTRFRFTRHPTTRHPPPIKSDRACNCVSNALVTAMPNPNLIEPDSSPPDCTLIGASCIHIGAVIRHPAGPIS